MSKDSEVLFKVDIAPLLGQALIRRQNDSAGFWLLSIHHPKQIRSLSKKEIPDFTADCLRVSEKIVDVFPFQKVLKRLQVLHWQKSALAFVLFVVDPNVSLEERTWAAKSLWQLVDKAEVVQYVKDECTRRPLLAGAEINPDVMKYVPEVFKILVYVALSIRERLNSTNTEPLTKQ
jgi:hypothetical protein